jgi:Cytochrome P450
VSFEPYIDSTISVLIEQFDKRFVKGQEVCDLGKWLQMFAFDVMGEITFSKRLGFLESGHDIGGLMEHIWHYFKKTSPVSHD